MGTLFEGLIEALHLLINLDSQVLEIIIRSLQVTGTALFFSIVIGVPLGTLMGMVDFPGKKIVTALLYTGMGFPPVVIGLFVFILFSASGPFGQLGWLFTTRAIVVAQTILALPLVTSFVMTSVMSVDDNLIIQMRALGASKKQLYWAVIKEAKLGAVVAIAAGFGAVISEVGAVMLVGGNIEGKTRVLTTAIMLETRQGRFGLALALGIILLAIAFITNIIMMKFQQREIK
ncbi:ABC transporter permease [Halarsenatibacter silvermanii]|uniref:Tungstate transport system permease protein n=1 Tax=Halarsenatibacter silvermanii TaxID=321763 RepID=A0A1G9TGD5_9FIRM|nr:ABC transporter permease [Halarsenatibacter silvermanii]SDM46767.1 tungstate transport system permease protein [Halarsenatibacter silvermanii]